MKFFLQHKNLLVMLMFIPLLGILLSNCDITNPTKNIAVVFNTLSVSTTASVNFIDAATRQQIGQNSQNIITVSIAGPDRDKVINLREEAVTTLSTDHGFINIGIRNDITPTPQNPIRISLVAKTNGYILTSIPVTIQSTGNKSYSVTMVNITNPPTGSITSPNTQAKSNSSGQVLTTINVQTNREPLSNGDASMNINNGTGIKDADGNPVTGNLTATAAYFTNKSDASLSALPTGLTATSVDQNGNTSRGYIQAACFASFNVANQNGQVARTFSAPVQMSMVIPSNTRNPSTNSIIKNGDPIPIWSYDETNAQWKYETTANAIGPDNQGNFRVSYSASHLSWWLAAWIQSGGEVCTKNLSLNINGSFSALLLKIKSGNSLIFQTNATSLQNNYIFENVTLPKSLPITIEAYSLLECPSELVGSVSVQDLCSVDNVTLNLNSTTDRADINVDVTAICKDRDPVLKVKPNGYSIFVRTSCGDVNVGTLNNGKITLKGFKLNTNYTFLLEYKNNVYTQIEYVDKTSYVIDYDLSSDACQEFK